jgi:hypothetical protein
MPRWTETAIVAAVLIMTACATMAPPQPPSLDLPKPPTDMRAVRKGNKVVLTWTIPTSTTDRATIHKLGPMRVCRGSQTLTQCGTPLGEGHSNPQDPPSHAGKEKVSASYTDLLPGEMLSDGPSGFVTYAVVVANTDARDAGLSNQVRVSTAKTLPAPQDFSARVTAQGVVLGWTGATGKNSAPSERQKYQVYPVRRVYRVSRREEGSHESTAVGDVRAIDGDLQLTDSTFEWQKTYGYRVEAVTIVSRSGQDDLQVEGDDSTEVRVFANDIFPPAVPAGLQAVFSGPGQAAFVDLIWAPVSDVDLDGYKIYRHEAGAAPVKMNAELVKAPAYRDSNVEPGKTYSYAVSAVDLRGNESARSEEASERVP